MIKRPTVCEEPTPKGSAPCHSEAKSFCTECDLCFCINHSSFHEVNCPVTKKVESVSAAIDEAIEIKESLAENVN